MGAAFEWIGKLVEWLGAFIPRWVILDTTVGAVKYVKGKPKFCAPGNIHWYWPVTTLWDIYPMARQTDRLESQTMETTDGKAFIIAGTITYQVVDLMALLTTTHNAMTNTQELAASAVHDVCCEYSWAELQDKQKRGVLKTELKNEAQKQLRDYGVQVLKLQITSMARCRVYKISQSTASEET
jgi:regulator of protease activity HflC (stomatin/prohibitin superfamily)